MLQSFPAIVFIFSSSFRFLFDSIITLATKDVWFKVNMVDSSITAIFYISLYIWNALIVLFSSPSNWILMKYALSLIPGSNISSLMFFSSERFGLLVGFGLVFSLFPELMSDRFVRAFLILSRVWRGRFFGL